MKKLISSIKYIQLNDLISIIMFVILLVPSLFYKIYMRILNIKIWLICEDGRTARDNGYYFYKYVNEKRNKKFRVYYVIDFSSPDYNKLREMDNIIKFKSIKHWFFYMIANYNISNHKNGNPNQPFFYFIHVILKFYDNRVFLQHGITKDDAEWLYYKNTHFKYFICGAEREFEFISRKFGYPSDRVIYTGFPRFDNLHNIEIKEKQILIMPTWRNWLGRETNTLAAKVDFKNTDFYKNWNALLNDKIFIDFIEKNKYEVIFYPHINMQKYIGEFQFSSKRIKVCNINNTDIQKLLIESKILITDYSSVYMDFAYMNKETIYYHFDYEEYRKKQYSSGYFDYLKDGFGPVTYTKEDTIKELINLLTSPNNQYKSRMKKFFKLRDRNNSQRIYDILNKKGDV